MQVFRLVLLFCVTHESTSPQLKVDGKIRGVGKGTVNQLQYGIVAIKVYVQFELAVLL
jgi:hypothetical protein